MSKLTMTKLRRFDAFEIMPTVTIEDSKEAFQTEDEAQAVADEASVEVEWSLYGHLAGSGSHWIGDYSSEQAAHDVLFGITGIRGVPGQVIYQIPDTPKPVVPDARPLQFSLALEVFYDLCVDLGHASATFPSDIEKLSSDSRSRRDLMIDWTNEFMKLHETTNWEEADYIDVVDDFFDQKLKEAIKL